ncbi:MULTISPECIES: BTAD domain-containing putative transcriptional regulator [unclassified Nocardia]|uniref:AfsR/SARP family transcriptional regulator n=1 Tax=unclassified Nocardia TaxID=2637762 RepID=UPI001CE3FE70|nr:MULTISPECIES: BTAD domain-containing putative transcriptional regulator [unclassified Nocardia]
MRFGVLGSLAVWTDDGRPVPIPDAKVRALLAALLIAAGRPVPPDRLIEDLWAARLPRNPLATLQSRVSQLRRTLGAAEPGGRDLVRWEPAGYRLVISPNSLDANRFRSMVAEAMDTGDAALRVRLLSDALGLWRGPAYAEYADADFARAAATRLDEEQITAVEQHVQALLDIGENPALASELADLVARHPLCERLHAAHLRALYRAGRQSEALAAYAALRTRLAEELGIDPGPELAALYEAILKQDPALQAKVTAPVAIGASSKPPVSGNLPAAVTSLIGRADAVTEARTALGDARLVTLTGPGGVGKSVLAIETARGLETRFPGGIWYADLLNLTGDAGPEEIRALVTRGETRPATADSSPTRTPVDPLAAFAGTLPSDGDPVPRRATDLAAARTLSGETYSAPRDPGTVSTVDPARAPVARVGTATVDPEPTSTADPASACALLGVGETPSNTVDSELTSATDPAARTLPRLGGELSVAGHSSSNKTGEQLLVLDNCDHVVDSAAEVVESLLRVAPGLRVLVTGREPLAVSGERVLRVAPLTVPSEGTGGLESSTAIALFVERATAAAPGFRLVSDNAAAVAAIVRRLDGIPVALELAAIRVRSLGVTALAARLDDPFAVLTGGRGGPARHRSLRSLLDSDWERLSSAEQILLSRLAAHDGAVALDAIADVDALARLVDRSLVTMTEHPDGPRYHLRTAVRVYALEKLRAAGESEKRGLTPVPSGGDAQAVA